VVVVVVVGSVQTLQGTQSPPWTLCLFGWDGTTQFTSLVRSFLGSRPMRIPASAPRPMAIAGEAKEPKLARCVSSGGARTFRVLVMVVGYPTRAISMLPNVSIC